eukprot:ANDGO_05540.mRNA.1 hypothetical protein H696_05262
MLSVHTAVIGGGPAGLAMISKLVDSFPAHATFAWIDAAGFQSGRVGKAYREVPSNTKAGLFTKYVTQSECLNASSRNCAAFRTMLAQDQSETCTLGLAADLVCELSAAIRASEKRIASLECTVSSITHEENLQLWHLACDSGERIAAKCVILATGSQPKVLDSMIVRHPELQALPLDIALAPSKLELVLRERLQKSQPRPVRIAVVGASHSGILVLRNILTLASELNVHISWFVRSQLRYATYLPDGTIVHDNTGLKGVAATWARDHVQDAMDVVLDPSKNLLVHDVSPNLRIVRMKDKQTELAELEQCSLICFAVGYERSPLPAISCGSTYLAAHSVSYDSQCGQIKMVPGMYGVGIAFPAVGIDPSGSAEERVGFWKFACHTDTIVADMKNSLGS